MKGIACLLEKSPIRRRIMKTMFIEVSSSHNIETVESLAREIWTEHYTPIIGKEQVDYMLGRFQSKHVISQQIESGLRYLIIQEDEQFIGYIAVQPKGFELFLSKIYVRKSERGKGFGKKAVQFVEALAQKDGFRTISLTVNKNNTGSINAYEKMGFRKTGELVQDIGNGFVMDDYRMEKEVRV